MLEKHWDGELVLYTDYATLRALAEAVVDDSLQSKQNNSLLQ